MNNTINGRTPDEIKNGLNHCSEDGCKQCPYKYDCDMTDGFSVLAGDAIAYIHQLERERDAAINDLETMGKAMANCDTCLYNNTNCNEEPCIRCMSGYLINKWQWRGVQESE